MRRRTVLGLLAALLLGACSAPVVHQRPRAPEEEAEPRPVVTLPWGAGSPGGAGLIEGFADRTSVLVGSPVRLFVSTSAPSYRVVVLRMGWYGGREAIQTWQSPPLPGRPQARAVVVGVNRTVVAPWTPSVTLSTRGYLPGDYLFRLDASNGARSFVPLAVRSGNAAGKVVVVNAVTTWEAYNGWGGDDLYVGGHRHGFGQRSRVVSFDRPYAGLGDGQFLARELPVVALVERLRLPVEYVTDVDLDEDPGLLRGARAVISLSHDEYWSLPMRAAVTRARDAGTNLAFLGANAVYRRIRLAPSPLGPDRLEINYKVAREDPLDRSGSAATTASWSDPPRPDPPSTLLGTTYECSKAHGDLHVVEPGSWLFAGLPLPRSGVLPGVVGTEVDGVTRTSPHPADLEVLAHSPVTCDDNRLRTWSDTTYYTTASGAGVFSSGTITWVCVMGGTCPGYGGPASSRLLTMATTRLLEVFATGPAGRTRPSHGNVPVTPSSRPRRHGPPVRAALPPPGVRIVAG